MNKFFSISLMALAFASCQDSDSSESVETVTSDSTTITAPVAAIADSNTQRIITSAPVTVASPATNTTNAAGATGLNPEHGKPGHRCDISVGAPLNSPVSSAPAPAITTSPAPTMPQPAAPVQPANPNARLNPAHGEPGHDCKIPVGQPLKG